MTAIAPRAIPIPQGFKALPLSITQLSLAAVLKCGQSFRWSSLPLSESESREGTTGNEVPSHEWRFCLKDRVVCLRQSKDYLFYRSLFPKTRSLGSSKSHTISSLDAEREKESETLAFIQDYFQLDTDLLELYDTWGASDPVFRGLRGRFKGIRMLRQDPWECLISFICSSNNNILRITKMVQNLCTHFSPPLLDVAEHTAPGDFDTESADTQRTETTASHPFPPPSALSSPNVSLKLRQLGFGYRADFIQKTAAMLLEAHGSDEGVFAFLEGLRRVETEKAREELMKCMGVGRKVADCVLLMSLDKAEVVPVDTHVHQIAVKHYGMRGSNGGKTPMTPKLYDEVNARLAKIWGFYAGWAHSVLFTADLKSFSTYGLPTPSPTPSPLASPSKTSSRASSTVLAAVIPTPPETPSNTPQKKRKRKLDAELNTFVSSIVQSESHPAPVKEEEGLELDTSTNGSLAERVKRRRRIGVKSENTKEW